MSAQSFVLDLESSNLNFSESNRTLITNTGSTSSGIPGTAAGSVHRYDNLISLYGINLSAYLTIIAVNNANIALFDDDAGAPAERFSPQIGAVGSQSGDRYIRYGLYFFDAVTGDPVYVWNYYITAVDIDAQDANRREYVEFGGYTSFTLAGATQLTVSSSNGMTRFLGRSSGLSGVTFDNTASVISNYTTANNEITFTLGQTKNETTAPIAARQYSTQIGATGGTFTNPATVVNPAPIAVSDYGTTIIPASGGVAVANVLSNDIYNGTTLTPNQFTLSQVSTTNSNVTLNTGTGAVSVAPGTPAGTYTLIYMIVLNAAPANFDEGTVTIVVNTPPVVDVIAKSGPEDQILTFAQSDFTNEFTDTDGHTLNKIKVISLPTNGTLKLSGTAITAGQEIPLANLSNITFTPNSNWNGSTSFNWNGYDGYDYADNNAAVNISITASNDAPVITVPGSQSTNEDSGLTFSSGNGNQISIADIDGDNQTVTVSVQNGTLSLSGTTGLSFSTGDGTTDATMTFSGTLANINAALNGIVYNPTNNYNGGPSTLSISTNDGNGGTDSETVTINVTAQNDPPVITVPSSQSTSVNTNLTFSSGNGNLISIADVDVDNQTVTVSVQNGTLSLSGTSGLSFSTGDGTTDATMTFSGTLANINSALNGLVYIPTNNYIGGPSTLSISTNDGHSGTDAETVSITVTSANDAPIAINDIATTFINEVVTGQLLTNDFDPNDDALTVTVQTGVDTPHGTVTVYANGTYTYTPDADYVGEDSFNYEVCDPTPACATATVVINVMALPVSMNDSPVAINDNYQGSLNSTVTGKVLVNDLDVDGDVLTVSSALIAGAADGLVNDALTLGAATTVYGTNTSSVVVNAGTLTLNANGTFSFVPTTGFLGEVTYTYAVSDGKGGTSDATVTITVLPIPTANSTFVTDDAFTGVQNVAISGSVLTNDYDPQSDTQTVNTTPVVDVQNGQLTLNANGTFTYIPDSGFEGTDWFSYEVCDDGTPSACSSATVYLNVYSVRKPPYAIDDINTTFVNKTSTGNVLTNDVDPNGDDLTVTTETKATANGGTVTILDYGLYTYTPANNYTGEDSFTYEVCDDGSPVLCSEATVYIQVLPLPNPSGNDAPVAVNDAYVGAANTNLAGQVLSNDLDADGNSLTVTAALVDSDGDGNADDALTLASGTSVYGTNENGAVVVAGTFTQNSNGTFSFVPVNGFFGTVDYSYTVSDGTATDTANVTLYITSLAANTTNAVDDSKATAKNVPATGNVLTNDTDNEGNTLAVSSPGTIATAHGSITIASNGSYTYTPTNNYVGPDSYTYTMCDNGTPQACDQATIYFEVYATPTGGNDAPVVLNNEFIGGKGVTQTGNVLFNDVDPDGDALTVTAALADTDGDGAEDDVLAIGASTTVYGTDASSANVVAGTLTLNADGTFTYVPASTFTGTVEYGYTASDGALTDQATVKMTVTGVNNTTAVDDSYIRTGTSSVSVSGNVKSNDTDQQGDSQLINTTPVAGPQHGNVVLNANGTFSYTPESGFKGTDSFVYEVCDDGTPSACSRATVYINIPTVLRSCVISNKNVTQGIM